jgi:hypothetical protein
MDEARVMDDEIEQHEFEKMIENLRRKRAAEHCTFATALFDVTAEFH